MKKYIISSIMLLLTFGLFGQGIYNNGAKIAVAAGSYLTIGGANGNFRNETTGSIDLSGTLTITGNVTNNAPGADIFGTVSTGGLLLLNGTTTQILGGATAVPFMFPNLTINNINGVVFSNNAQVNGNMTFTNGRVGIGNNNLTFGPQALISGLPSAANMILPSGGGKVQKIWSSTGTFTFPVGENSITASYLPVSLSFNSGTFAPGAITGINVVNSKFNDPVITGSYLNRVWNISQTGITNFNSDIVLQYLASDVTGTESSINALRVLPLPITSFNSANVVSHQLSATGLTSFGTFTGGLLTNKTLNLTSAMLEGTYNGAGTMRQTQDVLGNHWPTGVADHITVELHDATTYATLVYSAIDVPLSTTGAATVIIPASYNGSYYITIKHRNSLETTTAIPVSFASSIVNQSYGLPANVFGANLGLSIDSHYLIYGGDINQDGSIDSRDYIGVDNDSFNFASGYLPTDVDGNGIIDSRDFISIDNNNFNFIGTSHP